MKRNPCETRMSDLTEVAVYSSSSDIYKVREHGSLHVFWGCERDIGESYHCMRICIVLYCLFYVFVFVDVSQMVMFFVNLRTLLISITLPVLNKGQINMTL